MLANGKVEELGVNLGITGYIKPGGLINYSMKVVESEFGDGFNACGNRTTPDISSADT